MVGLSVVLNTEKAKGPNMVNVEGTAGVGFSKATALALMMVPAASIALLTLPITAVIRYAATSPRRVVFGGPVLRLPLSKALTGTERPFRFTHMPLGTLKRCSAECAAYFYTRLFLWRDATFIRLAHTLPRAVIVAPAPITAGAVGRCAIKRSAAERARKISSFTPRSAPPSRWVSHYLIIQDVGVCIGVGSEVEGAVRLGRRRIGIELKPSYYRQAIKNVRAALVPSANEQTAIGFLPGDETIIGD